MTIKKRINYKLLNSHTKIERKGTVLNLSTKRVNQTVIINNL